MILTSQDNILQCKIRNTPSHVSNMSLMMKSINPIWDLGIEHVARSNSGITTGRWFSFSSSVCKKEKVSVTNLLKFHTWLSVNQKLLFHERHCISIIQVVFNYERPRSHKVQCHSYSNKPILFYLYPWFV